MHSSLTWLMLLAELGIKYKIKATILIHQTKLVIRTHRKQVASLLATMDTTTSIMQSGPGGNNSADNPWHTYSVANSLCMQEL